MSDVLDTYFRMMAARVSLLIFCVLLLQLSGVVPGGCAGRPVGVEEVPGPAVRDPAQRVGVPASHHLPVLAAAKLSHHRESTSQRWRRSRLSVGFFYFCDL